MNGEVKEVLEKLQKGLPYESHPIQVVHSFIDGLPISFAVDMENDPVQRNHRLGQFYEAKELANLKGLFPEGGVFIDVGANVGNHSLFAALFLGASRVIPIEPNPLAYRLLIQNVLLNGLVETVELNCLGVGLGASEMAGFSMEKRERNLGAAKMLPESGDIQVFTGDALFGEISPDFIKIDAEGMELDVLIGLEATIGRCRPTLLIEVDNENEAVFKRWVDSNEYEIVETVQRYRLNKNFILRPRDS